MTDRNDHVREVAYFLWLEEGCPEDQAERHWRDAEALLESDPERFQRMCIKGAPSDEGADDSAIVPGIQGETAASPKARRGGRSEKDR